MESFDITVAVKFLPNANFQNFRYLFFPKNFEFMQEYHECNFLALVVEVLLMRYGAVLQTVETWSKK